VLAGGGPPPIATGRISSAAPRADGQREHGGNGVRAARVAEGAGRLGFRYPRARCHAGRGVLRKVGASTGCRRRVLRNPGARAGSRGRDGTGTGEIEHLMPRSVRAPAGLSAGCVTGVRAPPRLSAPGAGICRARAPTSQSARFGEPAQRWLSSARVPIKWPALLAILWLHAPGSRSLPVAAEGAPSARLVPRPQAAPPPRNNLLRTSRVPSNVAKSCRRKLDV
jgi:hypothetical protein